MSNIARKDVEHIAGLARIMLGEKEKERMAEELGAILDYIDKLKEVDTDGVEQAIHLTSAENILRKDEPNKKPLEDQAADASELVKMAPEKKDNFVKVKAVF